MRVSKTANLRVVISCVSFETVKIMGPIRHFKADRAYFLHKGGREPYDAFIGEVCRQAGEAGIEHECLELDIYRFPPVMKEVRRLILREREMGNHLYINVGAGPQVYCAAALVACMMEGGQPFNVGTKEFTVKDTDVYFQEGKPVGLAKEVYPPFFLPTFSLDAPDAKQVEGLGVWKEMREKGRIMTASNVVLHLERKGLMENVKNDRGKVEHSAIMKYRRNFLEPWLRNGWLRRVGKKDYRLSEKGENVLGIFC